MIKEESRNPIPMAASSNQSGSNDFVKKLFQMLQIDSYKNVVRWTVGGDSFVVLNTNEFTKELLPRHFKHSNFASFVRQLNKYDFHKVKISNDEKLTYPYPEDSWEFKHPDFKINDINALENIKRKGPAIKKATNPGETTSSHVCQSSQVLAVQNLLKDQVDQLHAENYSLHKEINLLNTKYKTLIGNIVAINSINERNYHAIGNLLSVLVQSGIKLPPLDFPNPSLVAMQGRPPQQQPQNLFPSNNGSNTNNAPIPAAVPSNQSQLQPPLHTPTIQQTPTMQQSAAIQQSPPIQQPSVPTATNRISPQTMSPLPPQPVSTSDIPLQQTPIQPTSVGSSTLVESHSTSLGSPEIHQNAKFHVLLVEDDSICIQLCRKFLVKYGCEVTVVTDGLNAISNVENTKYDLVLMDIVMPNLDGATATSVIRSFDTKTPIIAMTGNIDDNDLVTYLQNGMSDILAKPFTKDDLYSILAKHLLKKDQLTPQPPQPPRQDSASALPQVLPTTAEIPNEAPVIKESVFVITDEPLLKKPRID